MSRTGRAVPEERTEVERRAVRDEDEVYATRQSAAGAAKRKPGDQSWFASLGAASYLIIVVVAALGVAALVPALGGGEWFWLPIAILLLLAAGGGVLYLLLNLTTQVEKPSAEKVADLESQGYRDPEAALNEHVESLPEDEQGEVDPDTALDRRAAEDSRGEQAAEQKDKVTPSSSASRPVGPGSGD